MASQQPFASSRGTLRIQPHGGLWVVALNRPHRKNAFDDDLYLDLIDVLAQTTRNQNVAGIVLTGMGDFFSSGADLKQLGSTLAPSKGGRQTRLMPAGRFMYALLEYSKILAAAVHGPAVGIAVTLLLHMDLVYCSPKATFWAPFARLALVPEFCSSATFSAAMGVPKANEMLLLSRRIDAPTAVDWNIASRVVDAPVAASPFDATSLARRLCDDIQQKLLELPLGATTAEYFTHLVRGQRRAWLEQVCHEELALLDERFDSGQVAQAAEHLGFGKSKL